MKRTMLLLGLLIVGMAGSDAVRAEEKPVPVPPGFDRPLIIDRYLERKVAALERKVEALEAKVKQLSEQMQRLQAPPKP